MMMHSIVTTALSPFLLWMTVFNVVAISGLSWLELRLKR